MTNEIQAVISPVIAGMDLLVEGKEWPEAHAATAAGYAAANAAYYSALLAAGYAALLAAANAASAAKAASAAGYAAANAAKAASAAGYAAANAADATDAAAKAADATDAAAKADVRRRQRDLLLRLSKKPRLLARRVVMKYRSNPCSDCPFLVSNAEVMGSLDCKFASGSSCHKTAKLVEGDDGHPNFKQSLILFIAQAH